MNAWTLALVLLAALAVAAALALLARRRLARRRARIRPPRMPARPRYPVVLAHGLFGFDEIALGRTRHAYFRGVPERLARSGCDVRLARVAAAATIEFRARELADFVRSIDARRVTVVAHSMGGLDARFAIRRLGLSRRVAALVTVGTPHRGTPVADLGAGVARRIGLAAVLGRAGAGLDALQDLTSANMARFNEEVPDARGVAYASVVGVARKKRRTNPLLVPTHLWLAEVAGENDGVVPAASQRWGEVLAEVEADHWAQIGWSRHFDAAELYAGLLRELRARGF